MSSATWSRARSGATCWSWSPTTRTAGSGTTWRRRRRDRWGPGTRIPAIIISPFAKKGVVDHTPYDTTSILRFITERFELPSLRGIVVRDRAVAANGEPPLGDLTGALDLASQ